MKLYLPGKAAQMTILNDVWAFLCSLIVININKLAISDDTEVYTIYFWCKCGATREV